MNEADGPRPLITCWNYWMAVPTGDRTGLMDLLGLVISRPVGFTDAIAVLDSDIHGGVGEDGVFGARVYVSPELDGWTLIIGDWCNPCDEERNEEVLRICTMLSARYGRAQAYYFGAQGDGSAWLVAEGGEAVRRYCETGEGEDELLTLGDPLPYERARRVELGLSPEWDAAEESDEDEQDWKEATFDMAPEIAATFGPTPLTLTPRTTVRGTGVLALTPHGVARGVAPL
ncbi:hypothetical protein ACFYXS_21955 [Streptomyces sp. NPDC002574]|uniref:hypothetical protein n=1 Tax=Streptomyces sp. NPDC002574 TaxID=3364652 RepID=UPI003687EF73